ncbi:MAG: phosphotransferase [Bacteriovoracaceae bacterium]|nr:phosphotransferase [Bacteriovoracaceae bacterium]
MNFGKLGYLSQLRHLRELANSCLTAYPIKVESVNFIQHGENTTYKIVDSKKQKYLLRIHRNGYHSKQAIGEELKWLTRLSQKTSITSPIPLKSKSSELVVSRKLPISGELRNMTLLKWVEGRRISRSVGGRHLKLIAELLADLHKDASKFSVKKRHYWDAEGLVGKNPFMGPLKGLDGLSTREQEIITRGQKLIYHKLNNYQKKNPHKLSMIHADLHFGNLFQNQGQICPIDFDDCGYGFHMYDLAVTSMSLSHFVDNKSITKKSYQALNEIFLNSYDSCSSLGQKDINAITDLGHARRLMAVQWFYTRYDNPRLFARAIPYAKATVKILKKIL